MVQIFVFNIEWIKREWGNVVTIGRHIKDFFDFPLSLCEDMIGADVDMDIWLHLCVRKKTQINEGKGGKKTLEMEVAMTCLCNEHSV